MRLAPGQVVTEEEFLKLYAEVVAKAKEILAIWNAERESVHEWPAGQDWDHLAGSSKSSLMMKAREELGVDSHAFLHIVRNWPFSSAGLAELDNLFGE